MALSGTPPLNRAPRSPRSIGSIVAGRRDRGSFEVKDMVPVSRRPRRGRALPPTALTGCEKLSFRGPFHLARPGPAPRAAEILAARYDTGRASYIPRELVSKWDFPAGRR